MLTSCTRRVAVDVADLARQGGTDGGYHLHLHTGREIVTDHLVFDDSVLVVHNLIADGKRTAIYPEHVAVRDIESIEAVETNWVLTSMWIAPAILVCVVIGIFIFDGPGGGFENSGN